MNKVKVGDEWVGQLPSHTCVVRDNTSGVLCANAIVIDHMNNQRTPQSYSVRNLHSVAALLLALAKPMPMYYHPNRRNSINTELPLTYTITHTHTFYGD